MEQCWVYSWCSVHSVGSLYLSLVVELFPAMRIHSRGKSICGGPGGGLASGPILLPIFVNKVFWEQIAAHPFTYCLWLFSYWNGPELSSCNRELMANKAWNIYYLALYRDHLLTPVLDSNAVRTNNVATSHMEQLSVWNVTGVNWDVLHV